ncbi:MAG TPA: hypothetical protein PKG48_00785 [Bacteroidales bacterium]|nr:hypothetical protein [Bacteroidales bacterium]HPS62037.1 hypothetical protein [Bacteroidales bacterium]
MKTFTIILASLLIFQTSILFAGNESNTPKNGMETTTLNLAALAPVTPAEATFEDAPAVPDLSTIAPVPPAEADFDDTLPNPLADPSGLAPVYPDQADFE